MQTLNPSLQTKADALLASHKASHSKIKTMLLEQNTQQAADEALLDHMKQTRRDLEQYQATPHKRAARDYALNSLARQIEVFEPVVVAGGFEMADYWYFYRGICREERRVGRELEEVLKWNGGVR